MLILIRTETVVKGWAAVVAVVGCTLGSSSRRQSQLPVGRQSGSQLAADLIGCEPVMRISTSLLDRKSTRLNSSHGYISYAVFCLKKKNSLRDIQPRDVEPMHTVSEDASH